MHKFKELIVWQKARELVKEVYKLTSSFPESEKFGLITQIQRSCVSIPSNIAEGAGRSSPKDFIRFLNIAYSSAYELETQLILSADLQFLATEDLTEVLDKIDTIQKMIWGLIQKLKNKDE